VARGLAAGVAGTAAMTGWQELSSRLRDGGGSGEGSEPPADPWEQASTPAQVARKILSGVFDRDPPPERIPLLTNVMHWGYGTTWGAVYGLLAGSARRVRPLRSGLAFGTAVWVASYAQLVPMGLYQPPWRYGATELAFDLSYHLAYGAGVGLGYRAISAD